MADHEDRLVFAEEVPSKLAGLFESPQRVRIQYASGEQDGVVVARIRIGKSQVGGNPSNNSPVNSRQLQWAAADILPPSVAPTITTPTSASVTATTATLGGNVTADGGASISARGVVYAKTSTNSNPQIGGSGVTNVTGTGTTGVFTVGASSLRWRHELFLPCLCYKRIRHHLHLGRHLHHRGGELRSGDLRRRRRERC